MPESDDRKIERVQIAILSALGFVLSACTVPERLAVDETDYDFPASRSTIPTAEDEDNDFGAARGVPQPASKTGQGVKLVYKRPKQSPSNVRSLESNYLTETLYLNFVRAPAEEVVRAVIEQALGQIVTVGPGVRGEITLTSIHPVPTELALRSLETALTDQGLALMPTETGFSLLPLDRAEQSPHSLSSISQSRVGYGMAQRTLEHAKASDVIRLLDPLKSARVSVSLVASQNLLVLRGPRPDIEATLEIIDLLDSEWFTSRSLGVFEVRHASASALKGELDAVLRDAAGQSAPDIQTIALDRLNLIVVSAATEAGFSEAQVWLTRLDRQSTGGGTTLHYYSVKNRSATKLAETLRLAMGYDADAEDVNNGARPEVNIVAEDLNNGLIIRATREQYAEILIVLEKIDVLAPQVLIEATIVEVGLTDGFRFGVNWNFRSDGRSVTFSDLASGAVATQFPGFAVASIGSNIQAALSALESLTDVDVISAPKLMVVNNQVASLQVGDEVPIVVRQAQSVTDPGAPIVTDVELRDTGVILEVQPRIDASGFVELVVSQEVSDVSQTTTSGIDSPTIQQRRFSSTVAVKDGETVALGGLFRHSRSVVDSGVPILKDVPIIGTAFKSKDLTSRRTELIVFLTPRIVYDARDAREALDYLKRQMRVLMERQKPAGEMAQ